MVSANNFIVKNVSLKIRILHIPIVCITCADESSNPLHYLTLQYLLATRSSPPPSFIKPNRCCHNFESSTLLPFAPLTFGNIVSCKQCFSLAVYLLAMFYSSSICGQCWFSLAMFFSSSVFCQKCFSSAVFLTSSGFVSSVFASRVVRQQCFPLVVFFGSRRFAIRFFTSRGFRQQDISLAKPFVRRAFVTNVVHY